MANGHGTLISGSDGQGNVKVDVKDNGGSKYYKTGTQAALAEGFKAKEGTAVKVDWDEKKQAVRVVGM